MSPGQSLNQKLNAWWLPSLVDRLTCICAPLTVLMGPDSQQADGASLLIPSALIDRFQHRSKCTFDAQLRTETTQFLRQNEQLYKELVPETPSIRTEKLRSQRRSAASDTSHCLRGIRPLTAAAVCSNQRRRCSRSSFQVDTATVADDCCWQN